MIYFMFKEKERLELESILMNELEYTNEMIEKESQKEVGNRIKERALKERTKILMGILYKIAKWTFKGRIQASVSRANFVRGWASYTKAQ